MWYAMRAAQSKRPRGHSQLGSGPTMEHLTHQSPTDKSRSADNSSLNMSLDKLPNEALHRILACLPVSSVGAAAETHPALAAAVRTLPELSHVRLRLVMQTGECPRRRPSSATNLMHPGCYSYARK